MHICSTLSQWTRLVSFRYVNSPVPDSCLHDNITDCPKRMLQAPSLTVARLITEPLRAVHSAQRLMCVYSYWSALSASSDRNGSSQNWWAWLIYNQSHHWYQCFVIICVTCLYYGSECSDPLSKNTHAPVGTNRPSQKHSICLFEAHLQRSVEDDVSRSFNC